MRKMGVVAVLMMLFVLLSGCGESGEYFTYKGLDEDWSIQLPKTFEKANEEKNEQLKMSLTIFKDNQGRILNIGEILDSSIEVNEETLKEEVALDSYLHLERTETIDLKSVGTLYGALIEDHSTGQFMLYYKLKLEDKVLTFILQQKEEFTLEEEAKVKSMMTTLKKLK
ncbi:hypothetical protein HNQ80_003794 [Anaerosolibacter carboniphilus]|uniref:Uncharacterized protein n=1 Tax=Anaerosolibacter carboniphilus TaxID=1417629 RepID=A0A841KW52_9FIRM|nr:hypothetical protein [Anaerosolibacter carboniphilus]MBB6217671.1 hypothetical protein [Anaerosolibacter carboniphilus]